MTIQTYWPYDELTVRLDPSSGHVVVKAPWLEARVPAEKFPQAELNKLLEKFSSNSLAPSDLPLINWFFQGFKSYPLCYTLPSPKSGEDLDHHQIKDQTLQQGSPAELIRIILGESTAESLDLDANAINE